MWLSLLAASIVLGQGHAPADVPLGHWAHKAVDELFSAGILHGYSRSRPLFVQEKVAVDIAFLRGLRDQLKAEGALVGYPDGMIPKGYIDNPYELAVSMHAAWANLEDNAARTGTLPLEWVQHLPELAKALNMLTPQLMKMGAAMKPIFDSLNQMAELPLRLKANASPDESILTKLLAEIEPSQFIPTWIDDARGRPMSNFEEAVFFHAVLHRMISRDVELGRREINWMPGVVLAVSMRAKELEKLGADILPMIEALNKRRQQFFQISFERS